MYKFARACIDLGITFLATGTLFWTPSIALHWLRRQAFAFVDVIVLSIVMPLVAFLLWYCLTSLASTQTVRRLIPLLMIFALWISGPTAMYASAAFAGGGFATPDAPATLVLLTALFPLGTFSLSVHDGSCIGVLISSVMLAIAFLFGVGQTDREIAAPNKSSWRCSRIGWVRR